MSCQKKKNARQYQDRFVELYEAGRSIRSIVSLSANELVLEYPFALQWVKGSLKSYRLCRYAVAYHRQFNEESRPYSPYHVLDYLSGMKG